MMQYSPLYKNLRKIGFKICSLLHDTSTITISESDSKIFQCPGDDVTSTTSQLWHSMDFSLNYVINDVMMWMMPADIPEPTRDKIGIVPVTWRKWYISYKHILQIMVCVPYINMCIKRYFGIFKNVHRELV